MRYCPFQSLERGSLTGQEFTRYQALGSHPSSPSSGITSEHDHTQPFFPPNNLGMEWQFSRMLHSLNDGHGSRHTGPVDLSNVLLTELPARRSPHLELGFS